MSNTEKTGLKKMFGERFRAGSYATFAAAIMIVIVVLANLVVSGLPATTTQIDLTSNGIYSLSAQTRQIAAALNKDVTLYLLASSGSEDASIQRILNNYGALSKHIRTPHHMLNMLFLLDPEPGQRQADGQMYIRLYEIVGIQFRCYGGERQQIEVIILILVRPKSFVSGSDAVPLAVHFQNIACECRFPVISGNACGNNAVCCFNVSVTGIYTDDTDSVVCFHKSSLSALVTSGAGQ